MARPKSVPEPEQLDLPFVSYTVKDILEMLEVQIESIGDSLARIEQLKNKLSGMNPDDKYELKMSGKVEYFTSVKLTMIL